MRKIIVATACFTVLHSIGALAAPMSPTNRSDTALKAHAAAFEQKLANTKKWSDVTKQLNDMLPGNVVREFSDTVKDIDFPKIEKRNNGLIITYAGKKTAVQYKKNGTILVNGKLWEFRPLATSEDEINRLALFLAEQKKAKTTILDKIIPSANADDLDEFFAPAAAVQAGGNTWKADACDGLDLVERLAKDCPAMAVKMQPVKVRAARTATPSQELDKDPNALWPIDAKCPKENKGTVERISKNKNGLVERYKVTYKDNKPAFLLVEMSENRGAFFEVLKIDIANSKDEAEVKLGIAMAEDGNTISKICDGPKQEKDRYFASLKDNKNSLSPTAQYEESGEEGASMDAT